MLRRAAYAVLVLSSAATIVLVLSLKPSAWAAGIAVAAWLIAPYALLALALRFARSEKMLRTYVTLAFVIPLGALVFLTFVIYLRPDAQGAIAVMLTPLYQLAAAVVLLAVCDRVFA